MYLRMLRHSRGVGQLIGMAHKRTHTRAADQLEEGCMLLACVETGAIIIICLSDSRQYFVSNSYLFHNIYMIITILTLI